jgi:selenide,water dikinase
LRSEPYSQLLVGTETADDAAVWKLNDQICIIATTDFFMPIVDDPYAFGQIAATNAISDNYAMGGAPIFALAILGMPLAKLPTDVVRGILLGGESICAKAGIPVAGGHSIDSVEPIYGLAVIGTSSVTAVRRNSDARPGDALILTKPLGVGIYSAAFKAGKLSPSAYSEMLATTTLLNRIGSKLALNSAVHSMTDVTGFGLLGHALEVARASGVSITICAADLPLLSQAVTLAQTNVITGASARNWASYSDAIMLPAGASDWWRNILTDPQTSGGLLVSCAPSEATSLLQSIKEEGYPDARIIGRVEPGPSEVRVQLSESPD